MSSASLEMTPEEVTYESWRFSRLVMGKTSKRVSRVVGSLISSTSKGADKVVAEVERSGVMWSAWRIRVVALSADGMGSAPAPNDSARYVVIMFGTLAQYLVRTYGIQG